MAVPEGGTAPFVTVTVDTSVPPDGGDTAVADWQADSEV